MGSSQKNAPHRSLGAALALTPSPPDSRRAPAKRQKFRYLTIRIGGDASSTSCGATPNRSGPSDTTHA